MTIIYDPNYKDVEIATHPVDSRLPRTEGTPYKDYWRMDITPSGVDKFVRPQFLIENLSLATRPNGEIEQDAIVFVPHAEYYLAKINERATPEDYKNVLRYAIAWSNIYYYFLIQNERGFLEVRKVAWRQTEGYSPKDKGYKMHEYLCPHSNAYQEAMLTFPHLMTDKNQINSVLDELIKEMSTYDESIFDIKHSTITKQELESTPNYVNTNFFIWSETRIYYPDNYNYTVKSLPLRPGAISTITFDNSPMEDPDRQPPLL